ncbi:hypothetical protein Tco_0293970 [Tanacetum coccineum]
MFDEYFTPSSIAVSLVQEADAPRVVALTDSPMSTSIDQDAPSSSTPSTQEQEHSLNISQSFKESLKTPIFPDDPINESPHEESTSQGSSSNVRQTHTLFEHLGKWTKNHPIANVIGDPSRSIPTRKQLQTVAMWCNFDAFLTSVEPKNFKQAMTEPSWIDAMQEEIHEFQRLEVWLKGGVSALERLHGEFVLFPDILDYLVRITRSVGMIRDTFDIFQRENIHDSMSMRSYLSSLRYGVIELFLLWVFVDPTLFTRQARNDLLGYNLETMQVDRQGLLNATTVKVKDIWLGNALSLSDQGMQHDGQAVQTIIPHNVAFQTEDLDTYDSDYDDISNGKAVLIANISNYGFDVISDVPYSETYLNDMENQSVHVMQDFEQILVVDVTDNEITMGQSAQTVHMLTKPQAFYDNIHKQAIGYQNPFYLKKAQRIKPTLYDGIVISTKHVAMPMIDDEETLILEEESRSKMSEKEKDPKAIKQNISHKPIDYEKLNRLTEDFGKRFTPQQELSAEQAFWLRMSDPTSKPSDALNVKIKAPKKLCKISLVNESLKKLKFHLAKFDNVVKIRTTPNACTEGEWGFEHTKVVFNNEIIPFLKSLKYIFNVFDRDLLNEIMEVQTVFDQMDVVVQQSSVDKQLMNSMSLICDSMNMDGNRKESCNLEAELLKSQNAFNDLLKSHTQLKKHCISLECSIQLNQEIFQKRKSCDNQNAFEILEFFENNDLKAQLQDKDSTICKLKDIIKSLRENSKEENVNYDYCEIETKNVELENSVEKLSSENERLCNEINHVKQVFKVQFDSIKKTRVRTKEQSDSLIHKLNLKSAENEDLKAQSQDKVLVITSLKNDLRKLKGKEIVDIVAQTPSAHTIVPGMFKLDLEP